MNAASTARDAHSSRKPIYEQIRTRAPEVGLRISEFDLHAFPSSAALSRILFARGIDGVILDLNQPAIQWEFDWDRFSFVSIGLGCEQTAHIASDWLGCLHLAVSRCIALGYRRIGLVHIVHGNPSLDLRLGMALAWHQARLPGPAEPLLTRVLDLGAPAGHESFDANGRRFERWLADERPDVVIDGSHVASHWLERRGWKPGRSPGLCTLWVSNPASGIASVDTQHAEQGRLAVESVASLIQHRIRGLPALPGRLVVPCTWRDGPSLPPRSNLRTR